MQNLRRKGQYYEQQACLFLCRQGLIFVEKNSVSQLGEIDLIMRQNVCLVFVEVRYRKNELYGDAQTTITATKQCKVIKAAYDWMQKHNIDIETTEFRFDVIAITGSKLRWITNAFSYDE